MEKTLGEIAKIVGGEVIGDSNKQVRGAASFEDAEAGQITFAGSAKYLKNIGNTKAGAILVPQAISGEARDLIVVENPKFAFIKVLALFTPAPKHEHRMSPSASIGEKFVCGNGVSIGPFVAISDHVTIGDRVILYPGVFIGDHVTIGDDVVIYPNVSIYDHSRIGSRVIIHAGTVIGSDGFGFVPDGGKYHKIPQTGMVQIDDDVEIGAVNAIDRATFGKTWIKSGVKTDNGVHIAHNVVVGENTVMAGQSGIAGSSTLGRNVILAGKAGVSDHVTIGDHVIVGPMAGVSKSLPDGVVVSGFPEMPHTLWLRVSRELTRLPDLRKKVHKLEKRLAALDGKGEASDIDI